MFLTCLLNSRPPALKCNSYYVIIQIKPHWQDFCTLYYFFVYFLYQWSETCPVFSKLWHSVLQGITHGKAGNTLKFYFCMTCMCVFKSKESPKILFLCDVPKYNTVLHCAIFMCNIKIVMVMWTFVTIGKMKIWWWFSFTLIPDVTYSFKKVLSSSPATRSQ